MRHMNTSRTALVRGFGKAAVAALLIVLLFLSALVAGSSALHGWLHPDHHSPSHYCFVSLLDQGHGHAPSTIVLVAVADDFHPVSWLITDQTFVSIDSTLHSGRGPPCLS